MGSFGRRFTRYIFAVADVIIVWISYFLIVYFISGDGYYEVMRQSSYAITVAISAAVYVLSFFMAGGYSNLWEYASMTEYVKMGVACIASMISIFIVDRLIPGAILRHGIHLVAGVLIMCLVIALRAAPRGLLWVMRQFEKNSYKNDKKTNLLVIGAGQAAKKIINDIYLSEPKYNIIGIVDDNTRKTGTHVFGTKVIGTRFDIEKICKEYNVDEILLAIPSLSQKDKKEILNICNKTLCKVRVVPSLSEIINFDNLRSSVRDIRIEDLLERGVIKLDNEKVSDYIKDKVVLVTGGGGSIGSEICRQVVNFSPKCLYILDIYENNAYDLQQELMRFHPDLAFDVIIANVRDTDMMEGIFNKIKPDIVFHAAAHKHVPLMEENPSEAIKNNVIGTMETALCAHRHDVERFVLISTDKAVNPTNIMGATKRICEMIIQSLDKISKTEFVAVRFGNVLGSNGSVVPLFKKQIENGGPVTLTHRNITRYFMTIPEASQLVLEAASYACGGEIFVLDMGEPVKIYDLAMNMIRLSGKKPGKDIKIEITGLRPGEKIYEELLMAEEGLEQTCNDKIFVAKPMSFEWETIEKSINELDKIAQYGDYENIKAEIKKIVPTYVDPNEFNDRTR